MTIIIRKYKHDDIDGVLEAWETASNIAHSFLTEEFLERERHDIQNTYLPNADTWVAEKDEQILGFMALVDHEVEGIFVNSRHHGKGIGKALMNKAYEKHGYLEVEVFKKNMIGRQFYSKYGFQYLSKSIHEETGYEIIRLKFTDHGSFKSKTNKNQ
jgi:putative acetyltransferase